MSVVESAEYMREPSLEKSKPTISLECSLKTLAALKDLKTSGVSSIYLSLLFIGISFHFCDIINKARKHHKYTIIYIIFAKYDQLTKDSGNSEIVPPF